MDVWNMLLELLVLLGAAFILGAGAERLRQNAIVGYLLAGALVGPHAFNLVSSSKEVGYIAELGVSLLLFGIGTEFSFSRLRRLGSAALWGGMLQVTATMAAGAALAFALGYGASVSVVVGAVVALSSTACVLRLLTERAEIDSVHGRYALGILLFQDIAVVPLVLLITLLGQGGGAAEAVRFLGRTLAAAAAMGAAFYVLFYKLTPRLLLRPELRRNQELSVLLAVLVGVGATWVAHEAGLSPALGAFLAGMLLAESPFATQVRAGVSGLKAVFLVLFFSSVGMYADPAWIASNARLVGAGIVVVVVGKTLITTGVLRIFGAAPVHAAAAGIALGQVGEFSFVLATVAAGAGLLEGDLFSLVLSVTLGTLFMASYQVVFATPVARRLCAVFARRGAAGAFEDAPHSHGERPVLIVGYGPAGMRVARALMAESIPVEVLDLNASSLERARAEGMHAHVGDAAQPEVLEHAGVRSMRAVVVTVPDTRAAASVIERVRVLAPDVPIIARARYNLHIPELKRSGADIVVDEEGEVGSRLAEQTLANIDPLNPPAGAPAE